eukprot:TRINITY_DN6781_c0_g1_i6.p1 TRINITY_DN6781_c0_g1~~TRINITY_DN6781_c0_g1_i6.p1  ORF type:complete len:140 (-),score=15.95 TRINITY_DN6781_c0_g1_i6:55-474(-)
MSVVFMWLYGSCSSTVRVFAEMCGLGNSVGNVFQWWPQIMTTYQFKHKGALNLSLVLANMAVDVISVVYLVRLDQDWSAWTASMVDFMALTVLLYLLIKYEFPSWRHMFSYAKNTDTKSYDNSNEAQGLLVSDDQVELS